MRLRDGQVEVASFPGKNILELNRFTKRREPSAAKAPKLLVLDCSLGFAFEHWLANVPEHIWALAGAGKMNIVFDCSLEGTLFEPSSIAKLSKFLKARLISAARCIYLTQERGWEQDYIDYWQLLPGRRFRVMYADYWIRRFFMSVAYTGKDTFESRLARFNARAATRDRRFISLNLTPRESKVVFLLQLIRDGLWDRGVISFGGFDMSPTVKSMRVRAWADELDRLAPFRPLLEQAGRNIFGDTDNRDPAYRTPVYDAELPQHNTTWFSVVPETEMRNRPSRITEKSLKPLMSFHPLIFLGNPGSLEALRALGFETFDGFFDESYDEVLDPKARFAAVYDQVVDLCRLDEAEFAARTDRIRDSLVHNARWGLTELPEVFRNRHDHDLLCGLVAGLKLEGAEA